MTTLVPEFETLRTTLLQYENGHIAPGTVITAAAEFVREQVMSDGEKAVATGLDTKPAPTQYAEGIRMLVSRPEEMGVIVVLPDQAAILFRGNEGDRMQLTDLSRRDLEVAKTLVCDAMRSLEEGTRPAVGIPVPAPMAPMTLPPYGPQPW